MNAAQGSRNVPRSVGAVLAGILVGAGLSILTDSVLRSARIFPALGARMADSLLALATVYRALYGVLAAYVTARLAPRRPMFHALLGAFIGIVVATIGAIVTWNAGPQYGPHWYPIALIVLALPTAWAGGRIREMQIAKATSSAASAA
jgi:LytS/YehU family sensor histidine kinase